MCAGEHLLQFFELPRSECSAIATLLVTYGRIGTLLRIVVMTTTVNSKNALSLQTHIVDAVSTGESGIGVVSWCAS